MTDISSKQKKAKIFITPWAGKPPSNPANHPLQSDHQAHDSRNAKSSNTAVGSADRGSSTLERIEAVRAHTAGGGRSSAHLRAKEHRRRRSTNHDTVGHGRRGSRQHGAHAAAGRHVDGDLGDVVLGVRGRSGLASAGLRLGHVDHLGQGLAVLGWHLAVGVHAGRVGAGVVLHHPVHVREHVHVLDGLHGLAGVAGCTGHLVAVAAEGGVEVAHVWLMLVMGGCLGAAGAGHTNPGLVAGVFGGFSQLRNRFFVCAEALCAAHVGAVRELGDVDAFHYCSLHHH